MSGRSCAIVTDWSPPRARRRAVSGFPRHSRERACEGTTSVAGGALPSSSFPPSAPPPPPPSPPRGGRRERGGGNPPRKGRGGGKTGAPPLAIPSANKFFTAA